MNIRRHTILVATLVAMCALCGDLLHAQSSEQLLLGGWRFARGEQPGAERGDYDDSRWQSVTIPHDWAISGPFDKDIDKQVVAIEQNGERHATEKTGRSGALPWIGQGWYRTTVTIPTGYSHAELQLDGAMAEPRVFLDGREVGYWAYGYSTFRLDLTPLLRADSTASAPLTAGTYCLAIHLQNLEESSRWYPGAGLYRPVRLLLGQASGFTTWGIFARTTHLEGIDATGQRAAQARLSVSTALRHAPGTRHRDLTVRHRLLDDRGREVASSEAGASDSYESHQVLTLRDVRLWSPEHPCRYTLVSELWQAGRLCDRQETVTGLRLAEYDHEGFRLNGQRRKFRGVCLHHDLGPLGAAVSRAALRRQLRLLKDIGCDAIRTSHNMPAPWQMDVCDEVGMMVMAESFDMWVYPKCRNGYARFFAQTDTLSANADGRPWWQRDVENLVMAHRNHPSLVMWSIGNEIPDQNNATGLRYTRLMQDMVHRLDPTRPCTQGLDRADAAVRSGVFQASDIPGFNYRLHRYDMAHAASPTGLLLGSETASTVSSRGVYKFPVAENHGATYADGQISSYDLQSCSWSNLPDDDWMWQDQAPWVIGEFVWTGFDYLGEPTPYDDYWPSRSSYFGIYDLAGLPKDRAWLYRTHWAPERRTLHLLPHWTWPGREGQNVPVFCYTSYPEAELFVNGRSQGRRRHQEVTLDDYRQRYVEEPNGWGGTSRFADPDAPEGHNRLDRYRLRWMDVCYEPGEVRVVAYDSLGRRVDEAVVRTAGRPHHLELVADRDSLAALPLDSLTGLPLSDPDMSFVTVRVVDKDGNLCPDAAVPLRFEVKGSAARFRACCNGDATSTEVFTAPTMHSFHGQCVVVVEATAHAGTATLCVKAPGLPTARLPLLTVTHTSTPL